MPEIRKIQRESTSGSLFYQGKRLVFCSMDIHQKDLHANYMSLFNSFEFGYCEAAIE